MHFSEKNLFLARFPWISANSNKNSRHYNFRTFANISENIEFPENLQPWPKWCNNSKSNRIEVLPNRIEFAFSRIAQLYKKYTALTPINQGILFIYPAVNKFEENNLQN